MKSAAGRAVDVIQETAQVAAEQPEISCWKTSTGPGESLFCNQQKWEYNGGIIIGMGYINQLS